MAVIGTAGVGLAVGYSSYKTASTQSKNTRDTAAFNSKAQLANGRINAEVMRFDAQAPEYKARMDADNARLNSAIFDLNAEKVRTQGKVQANELLLREKYVLADSALEAQAAEEDALAEAVSRMSSNDRVDTEVAKIQKDSARKKALARAAYASMGVDMDSAVLDAVDEEVSNDAALAVNELIFAKTVENRAAGRRIKEATTRAGDARRIGKQEAFSYRTQAGLVELEAESNALAFENEALAYAESGEYMDWYADFIKSSTELKAQAAETGAQIQADQTFMVGLANASAKKAAGTAKLIGTVANVITTPGG